MGQDQLNYNRSDLLQDDVALKLNSAYRSTDLEFTKRELSSIRNRVKEAESFFSTSYDYLTYFNYNYFSEKINIFYDNFSSIVEKFSRDNINSLFNMLIDFDDDELKKICKNKKKIDYDVLFTIIFEPLEINTISFFMLTRFTNQNITDFFSQLYENIYLYKNTRKFDILYFLLPYNDLFLRNETYAIYLANNLYNFDISFDMLSNKVAKYDHPLSKSVFDCLYFKQILKIHYNKASKQANDFVRTLLPNLKFLPKLTKTVNMIDLYYSDSNDFVMKYDKELKLFDMLNNLCNFNELFIYINKDRKNPNNQVVPEIKSTIFTSRNNIVNKRNFTTNYSMTFRNNNNINFTTNRAPNLVLNPDYKYNNLIIMIQKIVNILDKSKFDKSYALIRFYDLKFAKELDKNEIGNIKTKIDQIISTLINDSFIYSKRKRMKKIIIEYIIAYPLTEEGEESLNISTENLGVKNKNEFKFFKAKIYYCWFLSEENIKKLKRLITIILSKKIKNEKNISKIFEFLMGSKYYINGSSITSGKESQSNLEKMFLFN